MKLLGAFNKFSKKKKIQVILFGVMAVILIGFAIWKVVGLLAEGESITNQATVTYDDGTGTQIVASNTVQTVILPAAVAKIDIKVGGKDGPLTIDYGTKIILSWSTIDANTCIASGDWSGEKPTSGSETTAEIISSKIYTLTCTGIGGSGKDSVIVRVASQDQLPTQPQEPGEEPGIINSLIESAKASPTGAAISIGLIVAVILLAMASLIYLRRKPSKNIPPTSKT